MSRSTYHRNVWVSFLLATFMVLVLPACWAGALIRARALAQGPTISSNTNEEEREEHDERDSGQRDHSRRRPPPPPQPAARDIQITRVQTIATTPTIVASVAPSPEPRVLSVKRLI